MIQIKPKYWAVDVPVGYIKARISLDKTRLLFERNGSTVGQFEYLPPGTYTIIGLRSELSESEAAEVHPDLDQFCTSNNIVNALIIKENE